MTMSHRWHCQFRSRGSRHESAVFFFVRETLI